MGFFDFLKKKVQSNSPNVTPPTSPTVLAGEKKFYREDSYYTDTAFKGTAFERTVITFDNRKKTAIPSNGGLYPAEILLLDYCSKGTYPNPKNGYPGFWWFSYGIRDVGSALHSLEGRGFITFGSLIDSAKTLTIPQLKEILSSHSQETSGKKSDLLNRLATTIPEEELLNFGLQPKYILTEIGQRELCENAYVPYMHSHHRKTTEDVSIDQQFNVWSINRLLGTGDKSDWRSVVDAQEQKLTDAMDTHHEKFMSDLKQVDPDGYDTLHKQDVQFESVQKAKAKYEKDSNLDKYISFWETLWRNEGLLFDGSRWTFELPDLYIKAKRYDDALAFLSNLKTSKPQYADKADSYISKIKKLKG